MSMFVCATYIQSFFNDDAANNDNRRIYHLATKNYYITRQSDLTQIAKQLVMDMNSSAENVMTKGSGYTLEKIISIDAKIMTCAPMKIGCGRILNLKSIKNYKQLLNIPNKVST